MFFFRSRLRFFNFCIQDFISAFPVHFLIVGIGQTGIRDYLPELCISQDIHPAHRGPHQGRSQGGGSSLFVQGAYKCLSNTQGRQDFLGVVVFGYRIIFGREFDRLSVPGCKCP